jgi:hypothetical protein
MNAVQTRGAGIHTSDFGALKGKYSHLVRRQDAVVEVSAANPTSVDLTNLSTKLVVLFQGRPTGDCNAFLALGIVEGGSAGIILSLCALICAQMDAQNPGRGNHMQFVGNQNDHEVYKVQILDSPFPWDVKVDGDCVTIDEIGDFSRESIRRLVHCCLIMQPSFARLRLDIFRKLGAIIWAFEVHDAFLRGMGARPDEAAYYVAVAGTFRAISRLAYQEIAGYCHCSFLDYSGPSASAGNSQPQVPQSSSQISCEELLNTFMVIFDLDETNAPLHTQGSLSGMDRENFMEILSSAVGDALPRKVQKTIAEGILLNGWTYGELGFYLQGVMEGRQAPQGSHAFLAGVSPRARMAAVPAMPAASIPPPAAPVVPPPAGVSPSLSPASAAGVVPAAPSARAPVKKAPSPAGKTPPPKATLNLNNRRLVRVLRAIRVRFRMDADAEVIRWEGALGSEIFNNAGESFTVDAFFGEIAGILSEDYPAAIWALEEKMGEFTRLLLENKVTVKKMLKFICGCIREASAASKDPEEDPAGQ